MIITTYIPNNNNKNVHYTLKIILIDRVPYISNITYQN